MGHHGSDLSLSHLPSVKNPHLGLLEDIADTRSSDTDKELNEFGGRGLDERHSSLTWVPQDSTEAKVNLGKTLNVSRNRIP